MKRIVTPLTAEIVVGLLARATVDPPLGAKSPPYQDI